MVEDETTINVYHSRIEEINADGQLVLAMPSQRGAVVRLETGTEILVRFVYLASVYQFSSIYLRRDFQPLPVWIVGPAYDMKKIQRRSFFRLEVSLAATLRIFGDQESDDAAEVTLKLRTKDLSGGGIRVITKEKLREGALLAAELQLANDTLIKIPQAKIVRIENSPTDTSINWVGIDFKEIDEHDRKKIVQFVFRKQLEHR